VSKANLEQLEILIIVSNNSRALQRGNRQPGQSSQLGPKPSPLASALKKCENAEGA
jgi:hypothetical protein